MDLLRAFDRNIAKQELRALLLGISGARNGSRVPHSFETDDLLAYAKRRLRSRDPSVRKRKFDLLIATGAALGRHDRSAESLECFRRALRISETDQQLAWAHYTIGHDYHQRLGQWKEAVGELREVIDLTPAASTTRALAFLDLATTCTRLGKFEDTEDAALGALSLGIRDIEPHARIRLSTAFWKQQRVEEAVEEHNTARKLFQEEGSEQGTVAVDSNLGAMYLDLGDAAKALPLLTRSRQSQLEFLDITRLGKSYHNEGMALLRLGRIEEAQGALLNAMRYHAESGRTAYLAGSLSTLGNTLDAAGDPELALCALHRASELAASVESRSDEFASLGAMLSIIAKRKIHLEAVPYLLSRAGGILEEAGASLPQAHAIKFSTLMLELARIGAKMPTRKVIRQPAQFPLRAYRDEFERVVAPHTVARLEELLSQRLSSVMKMKRAPEPKKLGAFLLGWGGRTFKNSDYQAEFAASRETSRYHLSILRDNNVIKQIGLRKAACYQLSFHLTQVGAPDPHLARI